jgi:asparagine synthase (glutamine-hydrolysing)
MSESDLLQALRRAVKNGVHGESEVAVAYSGGVDSSVVAAIAREQAEVKCYTCAAKGSYDALNAERRASEEGMTLKMVEVDEIGIVKRVAAAAKALQSLDPIPISYTVPLIAVLEESTEDTVLAGNGADELFAGYSKYSSIPDPAARMSEDLAKMLDESERLRRWSSARGKRLELPFADPEVISLSNRIPMVEKISPSGKKLVLREVARQLGLPSHHRPKKAAQYSSGVLKLMRNSARKDGEPLEEWVRHASADERRSAYESG